MQELMLLVQCKTKIDLVCGLVTCISCFIDFFYMIVIDLNYFYTLRNGTG